MALQINRSFAGGELAPELYGRADQAKYQSGLALCKNYIVQRYGGVTNRSGFKFINEVVDPNAFTRLLRFVFNASQTYILEFGSLYVRPYKNGAPLLWEPWEIAVTYIAGESISFNGVGYIALTTTTPGLSPTAEPLSWSILPDPYYKIVSPYATAHLAELQYVQSADVVTIVHRQYPPYQLRRTGDIEWALIPMTFNPTIAEPTGISATAGTAGATIFRYRVTALSATDEESLAATGTYQSLTGATQANPCVVTKAAHGLGTGDEIRIKDVLGMTQLNGRPYTVTVLTANTFSLDGVDSTAFTAYVSGGNFAQTFVQITAAAIVVGAPNIVSWTAVTSALYYHVYKELNGIFAFIGRAKAIAGTLTFKDINYTGDASDTAPVYQSVFQSTGNYPGVVAYYQQRLIFASSVLEPETVRMSRTGLFNNFTTSNPVSADDAVTFSLNGEEVNEVRAIFAIGQLVILTSGGEWIIRGDQSGAVTPTAINAVQIGHNGCSTLKPIIVSNTALYNQARGSVLRDLPVNDYGEVTGSGRDLSIFAPHLMDGYTLTDWAFQQIPQSVVWVVRSDGILLGMTYVREHEVWGWHQHNTDGTFESVAAIPENGEDILYAVVKRTINGQTKRYIERMATRQITSIYDSFFVDCGLTFDGRNTTVTNLQLQGGTLWTHDETLNVLASTGIFTASDVGNAYELTSGADVVRVVVTAFVDTFNLSVVPDATVPVSLRSVLTTVWTRMVDEAGGMGHLEGKAVTVFADGGQQPDSVVVGGVAQLDRAYGRIAIGLPITADFQTLQADNPQGQTWLDKKKLINRITILVKESRGIYAGADFGNLEENRDRTDEPYGTPTRTVTGRIELNVAGDWSLSGQVCIRQSAPLPLTILAVMPSGQLGG